ncbi:hypothetical protein ACJMK2_034962 [Sinanodonta woodiana]|uniref:Thyroglobulin type-1 domain-containing protein n=1 Tax=Sinanodonta woodiana TaxID=1069815 RepID=A0ABD3WV22_SINWO
MKVILCLAILIAFICLIESKKHKKKDELSKDVKKPSAVPFHKGFKYDRRGHRKHIHPKQMKSLSVHDSDWLKDPNLQFSTDCKRVCPKNHICIQSTKTAEEKCVTKQYIKQGRKLFKNFHEKKMMLKQDVTGSHVVHKPEMVKKLDQAEQIKEGYEMLKDFKGEKTFGKGEHPHMGDKHLHPDHKHMDIQHTLEEAEKVQNAYERYHDTYAKMNHGTLHGKNNVDRVEGKKHGYHHKDTVHKNIETIIPVEMTGSIKENKECTPSAMHEIRNRLNGWFVMLHTQKRIQHHLHKGKHPVDMIATVKHHRAPRSATLHEAIETERHGHCKCSKSVMWEFRHLDEDQDNHLSNSELRVIEENHNEACIRPFLDSIDLNKDKKLIKQEWCCALADIVPPCYEKLRNIDVKAGKEWIPHCDSEGYYQREQCDDRNGDCWCVDLNGNEIHSTRKHGNAHCGHFDPLGNKRKP